MIPIHIKLKQLTYFIIICIAFLYQTLQYTHEVILILTITIQQIQPQSIALKLLVGKCLICWIDWHERHMTIFKTPSRSKWYTLFLILFKLGAPKAQEKFKSKISSNIYQIRPGKTWNFRFSNSRCFPGFWDDFQNSWCFPGLEEMVVKFQVFPGFSRLWPPC